MSGFRAPYPFPSYGIAVPQFTPPEVAPGARSPIFPLQLGMVAIPPPPEYDRQIFPYIANVGKLMQI